MMGTLFNQRPRYESEQLKNIQLKYELEEIKRIMKEMGCSISEAVAILGHVRKEKLYQLHVEDLDIKDEQLAGFGNLTQEVINTLDSLKDQLGDYLEQDKMISIQD
jgi:DNA-binding protein